MQLSFFFGRARGNLPEVEGLRIGGRVVPLRLVRNRRARRYILRLGSDGAARVTLPPGGSVGEARRFVQKNLVWLENQLLRQAAQPALPRPWLAGSEILFRGEPVRIEVTAPRKDSSPVPAASRNGALSVARDTDGAGGMALVRFGTESLRVREPVGDLRPAIEKHLWRLAARELPARAHELAALQSLIIRRVSVRNQRSRWGSCSARGVISLNWRLVQTPQFVRDYIVWHELAHFKEMNHSRRFWLEVERLCPSYAEAESWLKRHADLLRA